MDLQQRLVERTQRLVAIPSISAEQRALPEVIAALRTELEGLDGVRLEELVSDGFPSLVVAFGPEKTTDIVLNAHVDVVPARPEQWSAEVRGDRLYGRGTQDMKGAAAVYVELIKTIAALPAAERPNVAFQFVTDEEIGGANGTAKLRDAGWTGRLFIAGEPTDLNICHGAKGILWIEIHQPGIPAHGSRPWEGDNPIERLAAGLRRLYERYPTPDGPIWRTTMTPAIIAGGDAGNRVPASASLRLDVRWTPEEGAEAVIAAITAAFDHGQGPKPEVRVVQQGSALRTATDDPQVLRIIAAQEATLGQAPGMMREHFGSDARFYSEVAVPAVCWGPVGSGLHTDDEWVSIPGLEDYYWAVAALLGLPGRA